MKISEYKKLEESIQEQNFNKSFKNINRVMFFLSVFGHFLSIFLAYFLISKIISGAILDNVILVSTITLLLLSGLELLKREIFDKFSLQQIKNKSFTSTDVLPLLISSIIIVSISFYASIEGAKEFSTKSVKIDNDINNKITYYKDSLYSINEKNVALINSEISSKKLKLEDKDKEQTIIEGNENVNFSKKSRIRDLKSEKSEIKKEIKELESKIDLYKVKLNEDIEKYKSEVNLIASSKKQENKTNSFLFVVISTLIEIVILAGVYFNKYYKYRSYEEYKNKIDKDPNYQKWHNYNNLLNVIYNSETKINDKLASFKEIQDLCKVNGIILLTKDVSDLSRLFVSLGILKSSGKYKYIIKNKESAQEILKKYFNID
jgi:hypothetical protein